MYHDSFEFSGNWCRELPDEFRKRRGYDLLNHLPALFGEGGSDTVARIKADYRETLSDLHLDYLKSWVAWSEAKGCTTRNQAHGSPSNLLDAYGVSGIPETETFGATRFAIPGIRREAGSVGRDLPQPLINRMASSAAHVTGKPLVAAEACAWVREHFHASLAQVKPEVDQLFLNGINHIFFHGTCYTPKDAPWPVYDIWHNSKGMQQMLTVHHPEWLNRSACGKVAVRLKAEGFGYDFIANMAAGVVDGGVPLGVPFSSVVIMDPRSGKSGVATAGEGRIYLQLKPGETRILRTFDTVQVAGEKWPVGRHFKPGRNLLEIEDTNLSANRIRDLDMRKVNWKIFHEINFVDIHYKGIATGAIQIS